jgi:hypothetical protein
MAKVGRHRQESHAQVIARLQSWIDESTKTIENVEAKRSSSVHDGRDMQALYIESLREKNDEWRKLIDEYSSRSDIKPEKKVRKKYTWQQGKSPARAKRGKARKKYTWRTGSRPPRAKRNDSAPGGSSDKSETT